MAIDREPLKRTVGGIQRDLYSEHHDGKDTLVNMAVQDCTAIIDANSRLRRHAQVGTRSLNAKLVARVPDIFYYVKWPQEFFEKHGIKHNTNAESKALYRKFFLDKLNDPDFRAFRIDEGRV